MATRELEIGLGSTIGEIQTHRVYARLAWDDDWELKEGVHCSEATWTTGMELPTATLYYVYGYGRLFNAALDRVNPFTLPTLAYVKIEFDVYNLEYDPEDEESEPIITMTWYGLAGTLIDQTQGIGLSDTQDPPKPVPQGMQEIRCVGMVWRLMNHTIRETAWRIGGVSAGVRRAKTGHPFNWKKKPNMTPVDYDYGSRGYSSHLFSHEDDAELWTTKKIVEYLLAEMTPTVEGVHKERWKLDDASNLLPTWDPGEITYHDSTLMELLARLVPPTRGLGFTIEIVDDDPNDELILLRPFTFTQTAIPIGVSGGKNLPANPNLIELTIHRDRGASVPVITDAMARYDMVRVVGARATYTFTIGESVDVLEKGWSPGEQAAYDAGASAEPGYPSESEWEDRQMWDAIYRDRPQLVGVYRYFHIKPDWDGLDWDGGVAIPEIDGALAQDLFRPLIQLTPTTAMQKDGDYSATDIVPLNAEDEPTKYRPQTIYWYNNIKFFDVTATPLRRHVIRSLKDDPRVLVEIRPRETTEMAGMEMIVPDGPRHLLDTQHFEGSPGDDDTDLDEFSWDETFLTITVTNGDWCEVVRPEPEVTGEIIRELRINVGENYRLDFMAQSTIVGLNPDGTSKRRSNVPGGASPYIRDDRDQMREIADFALAWYAGDRRAITFSTSHVNGSIRVGELITKLKYPAGSDVSDITINSVVTLIGLTLPHNVDGANSHWQIRYATNHGELDAVGMFEARK